MDLKLVPAKFQQSLTFFEAGEFDQALKIHKEILLFHPNLAESHYETGRIELALAKPARALKAFEKAAKYKPSETAIWIAMAEIYGRRQDIKAHRTFLKSAKKAGISGPSYGQLVAILNIRTNRGRSNDLSHADRVTIGNAEKLLAQSDGQGAHKIAQALRQKNPNSVDVLQLLAATHFACGHTDEAKKSFETAVLIDPENGFLWMNYGQFELNAGDEKAAFERLTKALKFIPNEPKLHIVLGLVFAKSINYVDAFRAMEKAISLDPKQTEALRIYATILFEVGRFSKSKEILNQLALIETPTKVDELLLADNLVELGDIDEALVIYDGLIDAHNGWNKAKEHRANCLGILGRFDGAKVAFSELIDNFPTRGINYRQYAIQGKVAADDAIMPKMEAALARKDLAGEDRAEICFALAKALEDNKKYQQAFRYMSMGNDLFNQTRGAAFKGQIEDLHNFNASMKTVDFSKASLNNTTDFAPIFVTGMPRSGTTLVERIISNHSLCQGAGETGQLLHIINSSAAWKQQSMNEILKSESARLEEIGKTFEKWICEDVASPLIPVDKTLSLFRYLGLIKLTMPKAKVVVLRRDPKDNLLSIYKNVFPEGAHTYAYSFENLVSYYQQFESTMNLWREELGDWFYELGYEQLVSNPDVEIRKLIEFTNLGWENSCLSPQSADGTVRTLSTAQARSPIYRSSTQSWQHYENELAPLFAALGDK